MSELTKKISSIIMALLVIMTLSVNTLVAYASADSEFDYLFTIKASQAVSRYSDGHFRSTYNNNNAWKVNLEVSGEGDGTATSFRLGLSDNSGGSEWHAVAQGSGDHYYSATDAADWTTVYLQGKNNNNTTKSYTISGYWDEETGVSPN